MTLTLLLDLDDTLLDSKVDTFIPVYFKVLSEFLSPQVKPDVMLPALMAGTRRMVANKNPVLTLQEVFDAEFFSVLGLERGVLKGRIDQFYDEVFPTLQYLTNPRPQAVEFVEWAFQQGYRLAVSTNPLFPLKAIHHRMRWAGLSPEAYPFEVVSSYETFHFSKPNPSYFAEVLGMLGWPDGPILMVGDDMERDIIPSRNLGLSTYWIADSDGDTVTMDGLGTVGPVSGLRSWLEQSDHSTLEPAFSSPSQLLALLLSSPAILQSISKLIPLPSWKVRPDPDEWSLTELLCHLRDTDVEVNLPRVRTILTEDAPFIPARNTDLWAKERDYNAQQGLVVLDGFITARMQLLDSLRELSTAEWQRKARHAIFGPTDLQEMVKFMAEHDRLHIRQAWGMAQKIAA